MLRILDLIAEMVKENNGEAVRREDVIERAVSMGFSESFVRKVLERLHDAGEIIEPRPGYILKTIL